MDKCWFVLKQVHYYPPPDECIRQGIPEAPLCLGHLVPSLRQLDHVINADEFVPFEKRMKPACATTRYDFVWDQAHGREVGVHGQASLPIAGVVPGVEASVGLGVVFSKHVADYHRFGSLEQWITSPTRSYVNKCLKTREVQDYIKRTSTVAGGWTMYMITGLAIARGVGVTGTSEMYAVELTGNVGCQIPRIAEVGPESSFASYEHSRMTARATTDFVWAVRLAKITKNGLQRDWSIETVFGRASILGRRATFSANPFDSKFEPAEMLAAEQLDESEFEVTTVHAEGEEETHFITVLGQEEESGWDSVAASESLDLKNVVVVSEVAYADY